MTVVPSASAAAIMSCWVAPTDGKSSRIFAPRRPFGLGLDIAFGDADARTHLLEAGQVQVDRARADRAAAGRRHAGAPEPREQRAEHEERRAHRLHELVRRVDGGHVARLDEHVVAVGAPRDARAQVLEHRHRGADVGQHRHVPQHAALARQQRREESGSAAFFEPLTTTSPFKIAPPRMTIVSTSPPLQLTRSAATTRAMPA
jgi:alkylated DNA nucleotide flippase Atl1